eukprot:CAMPEP_0114319946 /NCGR_PEP_ID=MMETSP0059-20121206/25603_1 /TAXON_ID=36894 /ORGANISM="Pyramimonas parkeae, Strain CCMP726" /LENGTH=109 /DNA_ID=CAMNT_0001447169 /DNA_START=337 /DNA_END=666 /DNA_ORIENTATION=+
MPSMGAGIGRATLWAVLTFSQSSHRCTLPCSGFLFLISDGVVKSRIGASTSSSFSSLISGVSLNEWEEMPEAVPRRVLFAATGASVLVLQDHAELGVLLACGGDSRASI